MLQNCDPQQAGSSKTPISEDVPFINETQYMFQFGTCLNANLQDIRIVEFEPFEEDCITKWSPIICRKCKIEFETSERLLDHILFCAFSKEESIAFFEHNIISKTVQKVLDEAREMREKSSFLVKSIADDKSHKLIIPVTSPLATYMIRGMTIYTEKWPKNNLKVEPAFIRKGGKEHFLFFTAQEIAKKYEDSALRKRTEDMSKNMKVMTLSAIPDVVLDPSMRSNEVTRDLMKALGIKQKRTASQQVIMKAMKKKFGDKLLGTTPCPTNKKNRIKTENVDESVAENQKTPKEVLQYRRKLRSSLNPICLYPESPKRLSIKSEKTDL